MSFPDDEKPSLDVLAHMGVLGMKWGQRKSANGTDIRAARNRLSTRVAGYNVQRDKVLATEKGSAQRKKGEAKLKEMNTSFLKDPDRVIASRMTRGEKAVAILLSVGTAGIVSPAALGSIAVSSAVSRRIEQKQDTKAYDKK